MWLFLLVLVVGGLAAGAILRPDLVDLVRSRAEQLLGKAPAAAPTGPKFNQEAAGEALQTAADVASRCREEGGPRGPGRVHVRYAPSGQGVSVRLSQPYDGTRTGECLIDLFRSTKVPAYGGPQVIVAKNFSIE